MCVYACTHHVLSGPWSAWGLAGTARERERVSTGCLLGIFRRLWLCATVDNAAWGQACSDS